MIPCIPLIDNGLTFPEGAAFPRIEKSGRPPPERARHLIEGMNPAGPPQPTPALQT